ncbi:polyprenyl synthetase family protein [Lacticaseibacillus thailandensis]|uniref:Farnesyl diphosphate synthase n=1 Tax=Lacticaseibacillus thailandensis DSM 22698 = JCM 13996 TaxID=1423810 RepID=A0A0R2C8Y5_9LACO|nr:farnesyl diphosphate synthase [Lacticaseibacillus thailandensis]KRM88257.1 geranyltranstransferase [Lacticaseibacillus thailandensis DSM 22698 = JCM 13996]
MNQSKRIKAFADEHIPALTRFMLDYAQQAHQPRLAAAMQYSLAAGGKRVRPLLVYAVATTMGVTATPLDHVAAAIEYVHTYSLIHDDLPAMDDAQLRRGQPANHIQFDEATAILAGDALLTDAFALVAGASLPAAVRSALTAQLAVGAGSRGMVAGQMMDIAATGSSTPLTRGELVRMHAHKTGALLLAAVRMGATVATVSDGDTEALDDFATAFGLAFQIRDDINDATKSSAELGKTAGQDAAAGKNTYVSLLGLAGAQAALTEQLQAARRALDRLSVPAPLLIDIVAMLG